MLRPLAAGEREVGSRLWITRMALCFAIVAILAGVAWADPIGTANRPQIMNGFTHAGAPSVSIQRTFRTIDSIAFEATYYDSNAACSGAAPTSIALLILDLEGRLLVSSPALSFPSPQGPKYRVLFNSFLSVAAIPLAPGAYRWTYLLRDCVNSFDIVLPDAPSFSVFAP